MLLQFLSLLLATPSPPPQLAVHSFSCWSNWEAMTGGVLLGLPGSWAAISWGDATIGASSINGYIAVGGVLTRPAPSPVIDIQTPAWVNSISAGSETNITWLGNELTTGAGIPYPEGFRLGLGGFLATFPTGISGPTDHSSHSFHVVNQGSGPGETSFHMHQFLDATTTSEDNGRTLIIF